MNVKTEILQLMDILKKANDAYYNGFDPIMTDFEYDEKKKCLMELAKSYPALAEQLKVQNFLNAVGTNPDTNTYAPIQHFPPMLSLDNSFNDDDLTDFYNRTKNVGATSWITTPKIDGLAMSLIYKNGVFVRGGTRGDGHVGEDLTASLKAIPNIPKKLTKPVNVVVRGEVYLPWNAFEEAKEVDNYEYANPRNAAAGIVRTKKVKKSSALLKFLAYGVIGSNNSTYADDLKYLQRLGFETPDFAIAYDLQQLLKNVENLEQKRPNMPYMMDGAVTRVNDNQVFENMGYTSHHPKAAIASKFAAERAETKLLDVEWTKGRKGKLSPNARLQTVQLAGTNVSNALLHTMNKIREMGVMIGDYVIVEKAAEIIPQVVGVRFDLRSGQEKPIEPPAFCPLCSQPTVMRGEYVYCENKNCGDIAKNKLLTFVNAINFKGIGEKAAERLAELGYFCEVPDFYQLTEEQLIEAGVAPKNATKIVAAIRNSIGKNTPAEILHGLSIDMCGKSTAEDLTQFTTIKTMLKQPTEFFEQVPNVGPKTAQALSEWFNDEQNIEIIQKLYDLNVIADTQTTPTNTNGVLAGMKICFTGTLHRCTRNEAAELVKAHGGTFVNSFQKSLDVLVIGANAGSKLQKAQAAGITVWTEDEFFEKIGQ